MNQLRQVERFTAPELGWWDISARAGHPEASLLGDCEVRQRGGSQGTCFSTTDWHLKDGKQAEFVDRWTTFLKWTRLETARLVADEANPRHFVSVGEWRDSAARQAWADEPRFLGALYALP